MRLTKNEFVAVIMGLFWEYEHYATSESEGCAMDYAMIHADSCAHEVVRLLDPVLPVDMEIDTANTQFSYGEDQFKDFIKKRIAFVKKTGAKRWD